MKLKQKHSYILSCAAQSAMLKVFELHFNQKKLHCSGKQGSNKLRSSSITTKWQTQTHKMLINYRHYANEFVPISDSIVSFLLLFSVIYSHLKWLNKCSAISYHKLPFLWTPMATGGVSDIYHFVLISTIEWLYCFSRIQHKHSIYISRIRLDNIRMQPEDNGLWLIL